MNVSSPPIPVAAKWLSSTRQLREQFKQAKPFPHLVLDDFLDASLAQSLYETFPTAAQMPKSRDYVFGDKRELSSVENVGAAGRQVYDCLMSPQFQSFLCDISGLEVFVDPMFHGGGFHQSGNKGFLDFHVDFNMHPSHKTWLRTLNVLLYLNPNWKEEYGGMLMLKAAVADSPIQILPKFNRAVIMLTADNTFHAVSEVRVPDGVTRKSIAAYAYQEVAAGSVRARTTGWAPEGAGLAKRVLAKYYNTLVRIKTSILGSGTAKNR